MSSPLIQVDLYPVTISFVISTVLGRFNQAGMVLEISQNGGLFQDFTKVGSFLQGGYNGELDQNATGNPLHDGNTTNTQRQFWTNELRELLVVGLLPSGTANSLLQFRWRVAAAPSAALVAVDDILVTSGDTVNPVPEPATFALAGAGLLLALAAKVTRSR